MYIDTTDVQNISAVGLDDQRSFIIECEFISGSDAQGCLVILVGELDNITTILTRTSNVETVEVANPPLSYFKVLAFDVEQDGSIGTVAIQGDIVAKGENKGLCVMIMLCYVINVFVKCKSVPSFDLTQCILLYKYGTYLHIQV